MLFGTPKAQAKLLLSYHSAEISLMPKETPNGPYGVLEGEEGANRRISVHVLIATGPGQIHRSLQLMVLPLHQSA